MSESKPEPSTNSSSLSSSSSQGGSFSAPSSNASKPVSIMPPHSTGYTSLGSVPSPSFHVHHQHHQQQLGQYSGSEILPHSAPLQYPKHQSDQVVNHIVVSSSQQQPQQQRVQNVMTSQGNERLGSPTGIQPRYSQQMARPSAPPPQERRELAQPSVGNSYAAYQNQSQTVPSQYQPVTHHNHYFQQQQQPQSKDAGAVQQHQQHAQHQRNQQQQSELVQQLGAPLPNSAQHPIQQSISAQNSSFQIQQQRPPPRHIHASNSSNQQHVVLPSKLSGNNTQQAQLGSPVNHLHRQETLVGSIPIAQSPLNGGNTGSQHAPIHLHGPPPPGAALANNRNVVFSSAPGSSTPYLSQTLSNESSAAGSPAVHEHVYATPQHYQQQQQPPMGGPHPPTTTFVVQQGSGGGQRIYIQHPQPGVGGGAHIIAQQPPPPQPMPQGYNGSHRFYTNAVSSMTAAVGTVGSLSVHSNPKEKYRELKRKFKFLVYENEYYQEELRNLQRKLLKLSRDKNFLLDRLGNHENNSSDNSSDDSEASVKTLEDRVPKQKRKAKQTSSRKRPAGTPATLPATNGAVISKQGSSTLLEIKTEMPPSANNNGIVKTEEAVTSQPQNSMAPMDCPSNSNMKANNNGSFVPPATTTNDTPNQFSHNYTTAL